MINYSRILQTGIQSLLAVACGWGCGRWDVVDAEPTVAYTNTLVLRFCIPCLQIWLLAVKTDMQQAENWRALAAFLLWSVGLQALLALHQLVTKQRLQLDRLGVDGLILSTNNTGILGPVVLEAAVGAQYAPLGMLATVVLYFQQLPLAQLLFQLHQRQHPSTAAAASAAAGPLQVVNGHGKVATSPEPSTHAELACVKGPAGRSSQHILHTGFGSAGSLTRHGHQGGQDPGTWDLGHHQHGMLPAREGQPLLGTAPMAEHQQQSLASFTTSLLLKNPLVWSTAVAVLMSALGSAALLDPSSPLALRHLACLEALLGWFAQTTAPLTLFTTGLWMYSNSRQRQQDLLLRKQAVDGSTGTAGDAAVSSAVASREAYGSRDIAWRDVVVYLALRGTVAPALMVWVCWLMGFEGGLAYALVILSLLPVAQTAFVVCKQAETGMAAVSLMLVASLFMMLPQLMLVLALLESMGVFPGGVTAAQIVG